MTKDKREDSAAHAGSASIQALQQAFVGMALRAAPHLDATERAQIFASFFPPTRRPSRAARPRLRLVERALQVVDQLRGPQDVVVGAGSAPAEAMDRDQEPTEPSNE